MHFIIPILSFLTVLAQIALAVSIVLFLFDFKWQIIVNFVSRHWLVLSFSVALVATLGSLSFSEILDFEPCMLCWYQRTLMYPQAVILAVALYLRDARARYYVLALSAIGLVIAAYNIYIQLGPAPTFCSATGPSCDVVEFIEFGYITIPVMSATAFLSLIFLSLVFKPKQ